MTMDQQEGPTALPSRLAHVLAGEDLLPNDLRWLALELYRQEHGGIWTGETLTAAKMNIVVDWWNARGNEPTSTEGEASV